MRFSLHHRSIPEKRKHVTSPAAAFLRFTSVQTGTSRVWTRYKASVILSLMMLLLLLSASGASIQTRRLGSFAYLSATSMVHLGMTPLCHVHLRQAMGILSVCSRGTNRPNQSMKPAAPLRSDLTHSLPLIRPSACPSMSHRFPQAPFSLFADTLPWLISFSLDRMISRLP